MKPSARSLEWSIPDEKLLQFWSIFLLATELDRASQPPQEKVNYVSF